MVVFSAKKTWYTFSFPCFNILSAVAIEILQLRIIFFKNSESVPFKDPVSLNGTPWLIKKKGQNNQEWKKFLVILPFDSSHKTSNVTSQHKK